MNTHDQTHSRGQVGRAIARGAAWTVCLRLATQLVSVVSTLVLARLLTPRDFGIYALAMLVYAFVELLSAFGFGSALIQNQDATDAHYNTAWTLHVLFSLLTSSLLFLFAPFAAAWLAEPQLETVLRFLCLLFLIHGLRNIGVINFQKYMTFDREFRFSLMVKLAGFLVTVPLAFLLRSYWAMLWGLLISSLMSLLLSYVMQSFRPKLELSRWREMISFSAWLQLNNILAYFSRHSEKLLVSRFLDVAAVGSLQLAREIGQVLNEVVMSVNRAVYPGYARVNKSSTQLRDVFCDVNGVLLMVGIPVALGLFSVAHLFVPTVLGEQWLHIVPVVKWLALASLMTVGVSSTNNVLIALGRTKWASAVLALNLGLLLAFMLYLLPLHGIVGVAYAAVSSLLATLVFCYVALRSHIGLSLRHVARIAIRPTVSAMIMLLAVQGLFPSHAVGSSLTVQLLQLAGAIATGALGYCSALLCLWWLSARPDGPELRTLCLAYERSGMGGFLLPKEKRHA